MELALFPSVQPTPSVLNTFQFNSTCICALLPECARTFAEQIWTDVEFFEICQILKVTQNIWKVTQNMHLVVVVVTDTQKIKVLQRKKFIELQN